MDGDVARSSAVGSDVEGMQELDQSSPLQRSEPQRPRRQSCWFVAKAAIESGGDVETQLEGCIKGQDDGEGLGGVSDDEGDMQFACTVAYDHIPPIGIGMVGDDPSNIGWLERDVGDKAGRRGVENDYAWRTLEEPDRRPVSGRLVRIVGENATPIGERSRRGRLASRSHPER